MVQQDSIEKIFDHLENFRRSGKEPPAEDNEYAIFVSGSHAGQLYKRVFKPSYRLQQEVDKIRIRSVNYDDKDKADIIGEWGWKSEPKNDLSRPETHKRLLPLICKDCPEKFDINDCSSFEVDRMLIDFLLTT